jgi:RNA polymerase sigma-70 factor (ECF subfamily)
MDEAQLVQAAKQGDLDAFNQLIEIHQSLAFNVAYRMMSDPAAAEDVTQDAFIAAHKKLYTFRGGSFKAWLLRIVTNRSYDELRKQKRRPIVDLEPKDKDDQEIESPAWMQDPGESPEDSAMRAELGKAIQRCLEGLDPNFRAVIILIDVQGLGYQEASHTIQKPLGTIKSRLARARGRMQECLQGFGELLPAAFRLESKRIPS